MQRHERENAMSNLQIGLMIVTVIVVFAVVNFYWDYLRDRD
jgi:uncharacterized membrane protein YwzB